MINYHDASGNTLHYDFLNPKELAGSFENMNWSRVFQIPNWCRSISITFADPASNNASSMLINNVTIEQCTWAKPIDTSILIEAKDSKSGIEFPSGGPNDINYSWNGSTSYDLSRSDPSAGKLIILSETFDPLWSPKKGNIAVTGPVPVNSIADGYLILSDQGENLSIGYGPSKYVLLGSVISITAFVTCLGLVLWGLVRMRSKKAEAEKKTRMNDHHMSMENMPPKASITMRRNAKDIEKAFSALSNNKVRTGILGILVLASLLIGIIAHVIAASAMGAFFVLLGLRVQGRVPVILGLFCLGICPALLIFDLQKAAKIMSIASFYLVIMGLLLLFNDFFLGNRRGRNIEGDSTNPSSFDETM
jgi:hypothetical protein